MNSILKRFLYVLGSGSFIIASCKMDYGMPVDIDYFKAVKVQTEENVPIEGLSVSLIDNDDTIYIDTTNAEGVTSIDYSFYIDKSYSVIIEDTDGDENSGEFQDKSTELTDPDTTHVIMQKLR